MLRIVVAFLLFVFCVAAARAQSSEDLRRQQAEIQQEITELKQTLAATQKNKKAGLGQLAMIQKKLRLRLQAINNINSQINIIQSTITQSHTEIGRLKIELDTLKAQYEKSVVYAYKNRTNYDFLNFIFSAANFNDALRRVAYLKSYRLYREQQADNIVKTQQLMQSKIANLEMSRREKDEVLQQEQKERMVLVGEKKEKDDFVNKLKAREKEISTEIASKAKADRKLKAGIAAAIRREATKAAKEAKARETAEKNVARTNPAASSSRKETRKSASVFTTTPEGEIISENFEKNRGKLPWPINKGQIKIHYGLYQIPGVSKVKGNNPGLTFETDEGGAVKAVFDGDVITVFDVDGSSAIVIKHGKYFTSYGNMASVTVTKGQHVKAGEVLGHAANNDDGNGEVEFLLLQESRNIDPEPWLKRR